MTARIWIFVVGLLVGAGGASFFLMRNYDVQLVPIAQVPKVTPVAKLPDSLVGTPTPRPLVPSTTIPSPAPNPAPAISSATVTMAPAPVAPSAIPVIPATNLLLPVQGIQPGELVDTFYQTRGGTRIHEALDIMAPRGREVMAVADGKVVKLFTSKQGGLTVYQFDPSERFAYYYAHLDRYAPGLAEGKLLKRGELVGYVGSTGNASPDAPHLHFAIFELGAEKRWWEGKPINPYPLLGGKPATH